MPVSSNIDVLANRLDDWCKKAVSKSCEASKVASEKREARQVSPHFQDDEPGGPSSPFHRLNITPESAEFNCLRFLQTGYSSTYAHGRIRAIVSLTCDRANITKFIANPVGPRPRSRSRQLFVPTSRNHTLTVMTDTMPQHERRSHGNKRSRSRSALCSRSGSADSSTFENSILDLFELLAFLSIEATPSHEFVYAKARTIKSGRTKSNINSRELHSDKFWVKSFSLLNRVNQHNPAAAANTGTIWSF